MKKVSLAEQLNAFASGRIIDSEGDQNTCYNFMIGFAKIQHWSAKQTYYSLR